MADRMVLDTSAVVAYLFDEAGGSTVEAALIGGIISAVNVSEVLSDFLNRGLSLEVALESFLELGLEIVPHDLEQAVAVARIKKTLPRKSAISRADCACIALAERLALPVLTADSVWSTLELGGLEVRQIR